MSVAARVACVVVAVLHVGFFVAEFFLWSTDVGRQIFNTTPEAALHGAVLAKNQGVYNLFLAAAFVVAVVADDARVARAFGVFAGVCVVVASVVGAATAAVGILVVQGLPGLIALGLVLGAKVDGTRLLR